MASVDGPVVYWCHQCNVQTRPLAGEDVLCAFCHQGFVEEVEPGITFSALPPPSPLEQPHGQAAPGQGHRPRILSGQFSGVPSSPPEAMMQVVEEMNTPVLNARPRASENLEEHASQGAFVRNQPGTGESIENSSHRIEGQPSTPEINAEDGGHGFVFSPTLILHGGAPNLFGSLEVFVDHGHGMGPQMIPNHMRDYFFGPDLDRLIQVLAENDSNRYGTPPAAKAEVEKLPKIKITDEHLGSELWSQCAVCKDGFELDGEVILMPCKHVYHPYCILPWLAQHNSCPICRYELPTDDADYEARKGQITSENATDNLSERQEFSATGGGDIRESGQSNEQSSGNVHMTSGQFSLWGMPSIGVDVSRLLAQPLNPFMRPDSHLSGGQQAESGQNDDAPREGGTSYGSLVPWLFRLLSSENLFGQDNESNGGNQSPPNL